jgi:hypothetical protein
MKNNFIPCGDNMRKSLVAITFMSIFFIGVSFANAAYTSQTTLSGGTSLGANYQSNRNRTHDDEEDRWDPTASASLSLNHTRQGEKGGLSFRTSHRFSYNFRTESTSWSDFTLSAAGWRDLSSRLSWDFSDNFVRTNDQWGDYSRSSSTRPSDNEDEDGPTFSDRNGNEKFWTNSFSTGLDYQYARHGSVNIGYGNRILEYDESDGNNYKSHSLNIGTSYQFSAQWNSSLSYSYLDANFDDSDNYTDANFVDSEDFTTHNAGFTLGYSHSVWNSYSAGVNYNEKNYDTDSTEIPDDNRNDDSDTRNDWYTVSGNLGWTHAFSPTKTLSMSGGPSYVHRDKDDSKTAGNGSVNYTSAFETGSWFVGAFTGLDDRSLDGDADEDLSEYKSAMTGVGWQVAKDLSASLGASFRDDEFLTSAEDDQETYNANASLSYSFMRWYSLSGRYSYTQVVTDNSEDEYVNHSFFIKLSASKELKRWIH